MRKFFITAASVPLCLLLSCQEANIISQEPEPEEVRMIAGRMVFSSQEAFKKTINLLAEGQNRPAQSNLTAFEAKYPGFTSMRTAYNDLTDEAAEMIVKKEDAGRYSDFAVEEGVGDEREITRVIGDPILATVVNSKGWLQIGSDLLKFKRDKFIVVKEGASLARMAQVDAGLESGTGVIIGQINRRTEPINNQAQARRGSENCLQEYWIGSNWFNSQKRRMAGVIEYTDYSYTTGFYYTDVYLYTKHQKRVAGVSWWEVNAPSMRLTYSLRIRNNSDINGFIENGDITSNDDGLIEASYPSLCNKFPDGSTLCQRFFSNITSSHWVRCSDGNARQCDLSKQ